MSVPTRLAELPEGWDEALHLLPGTSPRINGVIATVPVCGPALQWAAQLFDTDLDGLDVLATNRVGQDDASIPDFFPYLGGSGAPHPDIHRTASLAGLTSGTTRSAIARGIYEGFAMELAALLGEIRAWKIPVREVVLSGGASRLGLGDRGRTLGLRRPESKGQAGTASNSHATSTKQTDSRKLAQGSN
ncbi:MAG: FGGY-family carbohydrate kinase [Rectinemataceae bacterium]